MYSVKYMETNDSADSASVRFQEYLKSRKLHRTPERIAILEAACSFDGHFTPEELLETMVRKRHFIVSRATIYNTMNLLVDAGLVIRHRLGGTAQYEKAVSGGDSHFHLVCSKCGALKEFHDERLLNALSGIRVGKFCVEGYSLYVRGICAKCASAMRRKRKKMK